MIDSFDYKCMPLAEISPLIRIGNNWPQLPPEQVRRPEYVEWEELYPKLKRLYESNVTLEKMMDILCIVSVETLRTKIREWQRKGRLFARPHPRAPGRWSEEKQVHMLRRMSEGANSLVIAKELGVTSFTVQYHARRAGMRWGGTNGQRDGMWVLDTSAA